MMKNRIKAFLIPSLICLLLNPSFSYSFTKGIHGLIVLMTDYGQSDYYVGALKGSIYAIYPKARIDDISHQVTPFNIWEGGYTLSLAAKEFPKGTVFVAVVDPGVGTARKAIVLETMDGKFFVAPDNGLLTFVAEDMGVSSIREITNRAYLRPIESSSTTFHGRDIFGPVGAHLAAGVPMSQLGPEIDDFVRLKIPRAKLRNGRIMGQVLRIDTYGNVVTNVGEHDLYKAGIGCGDMLSARIKDKTFHFRFVRTYADVSKGEKLCHLESRSLLEMAINRGHLAKTIDVKVGDKVLVYRRGMDKYEK